MTRAHLQLLVAVIAGLLALVAPLVFLVRAMRRQDRRARLTNAPLTGLALLGAVSIGAWLWVSLTDVRISASIHGPVQTFLLGAASFLVYLLWLAVPVAAATWLVFKLPGIAARRPQVRAALIGVGIAAAIGGVYFAFLTGGAIWDFVSLVRALSRQSSGLAGPGVAIVAIFSFVFVIVLGSVASLLLLIAVWGLEPRRRWRDWRSTEAQLPPS
ncbi:MAG: hypothetical protein M3P12_00115 [Gemmatimonadota bacterium]|nr:hypothetical protein [Gemmatimonadota bacterium]